MTGSDPKTDLHRYLQDAREALLWKLDGLSEYNIRRPMVPTGTNLLGLIKHVASVELGYFGDCFGRPFSERLPWLEDDAEPNADMWATADESREQITGLYRRAWAHSDATIGTLALDAIGHVPWWPDNRSEVTLHKILVHMIAETDRHAGQADIIRELIDGATGLRNGNDNMAAGRPGVVGELSEPPRARGARGRPRRSQPGRGARGRLETTTMPHRCCPNDNDVPSMSYGRGPAGSQVSQEPRQPRAGAAECLAPCNLRHSSRCPVQGWNCVYPYRGSAVVLAISRPAALSQVSLVSRRDLPMTNAAYLRPSTTRGVTSWVDPSETVALR